MERNFKKQVGQKLHLIRVEKKLTQEEMAEKLHLSTSAYCKIEYGETDLTLTRLNKIASIMGIHPTELFKIIAEESSSEHHSMPSGKADEKVLVRHPDELALRDLLYTHSQLLSDLNKRVTDLEKLQIIK